MCPIASISMGTLSSRNAHANEPRDARVSKHRMEDDDTSNKANKRISNAPKKKESKYLSFQSNINSLDVSCFKSGSGCKEN